MDFQGLSSECWMTFQNSLARADTQRRTLGLELHMLDSRLGLIMCACV